MMFKLYKNPAFLFFFLFVFSFPGNGQSVSFEPSFTIGMEESDSTEYLFSGPKTITSDSKGRVYIADGSSNTIRAFDQKGNYITSAGQRGRGPGEFVNIEHFFSRNDTLYVLDRRLKRVILFTNSLKDDQAININAKFSDPFAFYPLQSGNYLVFAAGAGDPLKNLEVAYIFDEELETIKDKFLPPYPNIYESEETFFQFLFSSPFYESTSFGNNKIALVHENFGGKIVIVDPGNKNNPFYSIGKWDRSNFNILDWEKRSQYRNSDIRGLETTSMGEGYAFQSTSTVGLVGNKKYLVHFYAPLKDNLRISKVNIYNEKAELIATKELNSTDLNLYQENGRIGLIPKHMDEQNQIYFADYTNGQGFPLVRVVKMNVENP